MLEKPTPSPLGEMTGDELPSYTYEPLRGNINICITRKSDITYLTLASEDESDIGGFEVARFNDPDFEDPQIRAVWKTPPGFGAAPREAGRYIDRIEKAAMGDDFVVESVHEHVGKDATIASAEEHLNHLPTIGDFERLCQESYKKGVLEIGMFGCIWPDTRTSPRGEMWLVGERLTVRSYVEPDIVGESGILAMKDFFGITALYHEFTQDFEAVLRRAFLEK